MSKSSEHAYERMGRRIFATAMMENRCGELLECLHEGGTATVDPSGRLVMVSKETLEGFGTGDNE